MHSWSTPGTAPGQSRFTPVLRLCVCPDMAGPAWFPLGATTLPDSSPVKPAASPRPEMQHEAVLKLSKPWNGASSMSTGKLTKGSKEEKRRCKILKQLQDDWNNEKHELQVDSKLLIDSKISAIPPHIGLLYQRKCRFQTVSKGFLPGPALAAGLLAVSGLLAFLFSIIDISTIALVLTPAIEAFSQQLSSSPWSAIKAILRLYFIFLVVIYTLAYTAGYFRGNFSLGIEGIALDLNALYHDAPEGRIGTDWSECLSVRWFWWWGFPLTVLLREGGAVRLWVPRSDRDWLIDVVRLLIAHHHSELKGKLPSRNKKTGT